MDMSIFMEMACDGLYRILVWKLGIFPRKIFPDATLREDLRLDSVDMVDLGAAIEEKFRIDQTETARILASDIEVETLAGFIAGKLHDFIEKKPAE